MERYTGKPSTFAPSSHNHTIANITDIGKASVNFANSAGCPQGFSSRTTTATWGNQTGTVVTDWHTSNGGDIAFRDNSGQLNVVIDGFFYQNEGKNLVLDSGNYSNYAATKIHTHTISNITNLQTTLDGKSNTNHTHDLNQMLIHLQTVRQIQLIQIIILLNMLVVDQLPQLIIEDHILLYGII